ncbi:hypothetical protein J7E50_02675 [Pedobacter sp. ISL-68]|uniref:hypothetical protein n=1 Tax=unclassified Pedobacter TaxID=2628915 RepID=UPI001BE6898E|nr:MULTISPECIES: hypothetical protein [unclassified Pedobacter]MBT2560124.1 hypothetical protein [Pedobacter sp. ISL-64]MBT2589103.1 hypothetical protein [Pedobacter sp. ISL-68]
MKTIILTPLLLLLGFLTADAQKKALNIPGIWQLTDYSKSENKLQNSARDKQSLTTASEAGNRTMLARLKDTYRILQQRYNSLGTAINIANIGLQATPMVNRIISNQARLYQLAGSNPAIIPLVYRSEIEFVEKAYSLANYLTGLCAALGDINQMKMADRKMLFDFILSELNVIRNLSGNLLSSAQYASLNTLIRSVNPFRDYIDQDRSLIEEIINNAKYLKQ